MLDHQVREPLTIYQYNPSAEMLCKLDGLLTECGCQRWSHFLRQPAKVDSPMRRTIRHEDAETVFG